MASTALITGASGLIGSWTLHHWDVPDLRPLPVSSGDADLLEPGAATDLLARSTPAVVVHLAWCASGRGDYRSSPENERWVTASLELAKACRATGTPLWVTGTVVDEEADAADEYARAKASLRRELHGAIGRGAVGWLRPHYVFDEGRRRPALVEHALSAKERGSPAELRAPDSRHDFVHAGDVGAAVVSAVRHRLTGVVPIGAGRTRRVSEVVEALGAQWRAAGDDPRAATAHESAAADISRLTATGWHPDRTEEFFRHE